jgi:hypothetical protein
MQEKKGHREMRLLSVNSAAIAAASLFEEECCRAAPASNPTDNIITCLLSMTPAHFLIQTSTSQIASKDKSEERVFQDFHRN